MHVVAPDGETYDWPISSARSGYHTPRGYYRAEHLERFHRSRKYNWSPMPHSIFFRGGYAIHGTGSVAELGRPASHGCIRLAPGNAALLYLMVEQEGARISISGSPPITRQHYAHQHHYGALDYAPFAGSYRSLFNLGLWFKDPSGSGR
jgi:lipoprotein-anchoring transpeptidase ErfK/SrfK